MPTQTRRDRRKTSRNWTARTRSPKTWSVSNCVELSLTGALAFSQLYPKKIGGLIGGYTVYSSSDSDDSNSDDTSTYTGTGSTYS